MFMIDFKQLNWWYWLATAGLLTAGVVGYPLGFHLAISLSLVQLIHFLLQDRIEIHGKAIWQYLGYHR